MYVQIMEQVRARIAVGDWKPGHSLPSIRRLASALRVSVITVKRAYLELEREGVIHTRQGKGSVVAERPELGLELRRRELTDQLERTAELARTLGLSESELVQALKDTLRKPSQEGSS